ncbi:MAG: guanine deaminase [Rhizomicrobium sp.]
MSRTAYRGAIFHLLDDPDMAGPDAAVFYDDGVLIVEDGFIVELMPWSEDALAHIHGIPVEHFPDGLIMPGFIDAHVHYPQTEIMAAPGTELLEWLTRYTFVAEARYGYPEVAREAAGFFLDQLVANGVTTALVFATSHKTSVEALFNAALARNMRLISGKVLMDINAPPALCDTVETGYMDSKALIRDYLGRGRLGYAVTPRFALTSSPQQLEMAARLLAEHPGVLLQTHLSENTRELRAAHQLFPDCADYFAVYEKFGLATDHAVFAHGVHLSASEWRRLAASGGALAHCPSSNMFLGSGLFDIGAARAAGAAVALGSDVGAGTSLSPFATMADAYKVARLKGYGIDAAKLFYMATLGAARALKIDRCVGNLQPGKEADFVLLNAHALPLLARRWAVARDPVEKLFALAILGDDRAVARSYIAGAQAYHRI